MEPLFAVEITVLINSELTKPRRQMLPIRAMVLVLSTLVIISPTWQFVFGIYLSRIRKRGPQHILNGSAASSWGP